MLDGLAFNSLRAELAGFNHLNIRLRGLAFNLANRDRRLILNFVIFKNSHIENRCPFYDYQFAEWAACLPIEQKIDKQFHYALIKRVAPKLALIPRDKDFRLPTNNRFVRSVHAAYDRLTQMLGRQLGLGHPKLTLYADYENYLRHELREWAEAILFDERTSSRGIFRPEALRSLMDRHLAGHEQWTIGKIAPIITFEMMMRRFFDESPEPLSLNRGEAKS
jgi:asparagine synthase (glutamine-hydrolysing)